MVPFILTVGTRPRWVLSRTPRPLYFRGKSRGKPQSRPVNQVVQSRNTRQQLLCWSGNSSFMETEVSPLLLRSLKCRRSGLVLKGISKVTNRCVNVRVSLSDGVGRLVSRVTTRLEQQFIVICWRYFVQNADSWNVWFAIIMDTSCLESVPGVRCQHSLCVVLFRWNSIAVEAVEVPRHTLLSGEFHKIALCHSLLRQLLSVRDRPTKQPTSLLTPWGIVLLE